MQVAQVLKGDPTWVKHLLTLLAVTNEIQIIEITQSNGSYLVVSDDSGGTGQTIEVLRGTPQDLAVAMTALGSVQAFARTFSAGFYLVVY